MEMTVTVPCGFRGTLPLPYPADSSMEGHQIRSPAALFTPTLSQPNCADEKLAWVAVRNLPGSRRSESGEDTWAEDDRVLFLLLKIGMGIWSFN